MKTVTLKQFLADWPGAAIGLTTKQTNFSVVCGQRELVVANYRQLGTLLGYGPGQGGYADVLACEVNELDGEGYDIGRLDRFNVPMA